MAINSLFPGFVKLFYTSNAHTHVQVIPVQVYSGVGGAWFLSEKASSVGRTWVTSITDYVTAFRSAIPNGATVNFAELWTMADATADPIFRESTNFALAGTGGAGAAIANSQVTIAYRSQNGGLYKWVSVENNIVVNTIYQPPFTATQLVTLHTYLIGNTSCVSARDGGFLIAALRAISKTNDKLRKKFLLDA